MDSNKPKSSFRRFQSYLMPYKWYFITSILFGMIKFLLPVYIAWMFGKIITILSEESLSVEQKGEQILIFIGIGLGTSIVTPIFVYYRTMLATKGAQHVICDLRVDLFSHVQSLSHSFFDKHLAGSITSRIINDVTLTQVFLKQVIVQSWMHIGVVLIILSYFFSVNWRLALLSLILIPVQLFVIKGLGSKIKKVSKKMQNEMAQLSGLTMESISNITVVKTFTAENDEKSRFEESSESLKEQAVKNAHWSALNQTANSFCNAIAPLIVVAAGTYILIHSPNELSTGELVAFVLMQNKLFNPLNNLADMQTIISEAAASIERIYELFDTRPSIKNKKNALKPKSLTGHIKIDKLAFSYKENEPIINQVSLEILPKQNVAFVGPSGSGKSTLIQLITRFYNIEKGSIQIDDHDIQDYHIRKLRKRISLVPQEPMLFSGTIYENIAYASPNASTEEVFKAAAQAYADDFILKLPQTYSTKIGENGCRLSGGQKQRIAIARAFLRNPSILILDEATSALDNESEALVQKALSELMKDKTTITIAHRLTTIEKSDIIFVFDQGKLIEKGNHKELLSQEGFYHRLINTNKHVQSA